MGDAGRDTDEAGAGLVVMRPERGISGPSLGGKAIIRSQCFEKGEFWLEMALSEPVFRVEAFRVHCVAWEPDDPGCACSGLRLITHVTYGEERFDGWEGDTRPKR